MVEGEDELIISENWICKNLDGIVLFNSKGKIVENDIKFNTNAGVVTLGQTTASLTDNSIEGNMTSLKDKKEAEDSGSIGVLIKEPSDPELIKNTISNNRLDVEIESKK